MIYPKLTLTIECIFAVQPFVNRIMGAAAADADAGPRIVKMCRN